MSWTAIDIPDQTGRIVLVTGANCGLGLETCRALLKRGATVLMGCRSRSRGETARSMLMSTRQSGAVDLLDLDLSDLESVRRCAALVTEQYGRLDLLVNNAGIMAPPRTLSRQGYELQFAVNHLGHMALTLAVLPLMEQRLAARVVCVTSGAQYFGKISWNDIHSEKRYRRYEAYSQSKLANVMFALELNRREQHRGSGIACLAAHPGFSRTELQLKAVASSNAWHESILYRLMDPLFQSAAMGALPQLYAATAGTAKGGEHYGPASLGGIRGFPKCWPVARAAMNVSACKRLWRISEMLLEGRQEDAVEYSLTASAAAPDQQQNEG
ncbi:hypothetical protein OMCYN_00798 [cyanobiont of Ornithocercus magnificus]|nr:hypothetical protein OMCYN_00798 [cyanobiont of Ornithocercus magnificus]